MTCHSLLVLALQGVECQQCKGFYEALESWGTATGQQQVRLACGHVQQQGAGRLGCAETECLHRAVVVRIGNAHGAWMSRHAAGASQQAFLLSCPFAGVAPPLVREQLRQEGSRHRYQWQPPATQEGFWNMVRLLLSTLCCLGMFQKLPTAVSAHSVSAPLLACCVCTSA